MNRPLCHKILIVAEMLLLALPVSVFCLFFGLALLMTVGFPWGLEELAIMLFAVVGMLGIVGLWCAAVTYLARRARSIWWWRAACAGAGLVTVSLMLFCLIAFGWELPEWGIIIALGVFASPLLVPFFHLAYLQRTPRELLSTQVQQ
ncbi:hypothetical protein EKK97_03970 [Billgrantia tianxiuensis]|uniref:Transmembrane protein n=1 Tax=Billgrantia tianxiuensis TaxID=2497861 RepID=A0A6I6SM29_9GAMM|nr:MULTISPECIES: hypothetical protein [Halomonas]MCE8033174.1 hypothetical protein [Halomonas sp. MCCC 1A11057]QHC48930.1 hypothetical protein EKK97_03970 [Halomonas tianxiuensis]